MHQRLLTKSRLYSMGISQEDRCPICGTEEETTQHLFFECVYSQQYLREVLQWMNIGIQNTEITGIWRRVTRLLKGRRCREVATAILAALVYWIWKARNIVVWDFKLPTTTYIVRQIKQECRMRKSTYLKSKTSIQEREWIEKIMQK
ncbi:uncharacterized protein [Nicotiana sylvestris]|uniref:uncharacterized protein n=1 Tax=Nicotiana sylvestris TaxID=4096 RepID=UPI00388C8297